MDCTDDGRVEGPMLLEKELFETLREETEGLREETEEEKEVFREAPAIEVAFTAALTGRELGGAGAGLAASPARSASVLRFKVPVPEGGGSMDEDRILLADAEISINFSGDGIRLGWRSCEVNYNESVSLLLCFKEDTLPNSRCSPWFR